MTEDLAKCNQRLTEGDGRCSLPAGLGVDGSLGMGPCHFHMRTEVLSGDGVLETTQAHAREIAKPSDWVYKMSRDTRLGEIMCDMGAELHVNRSPTGVRNIDLDFEIKACRAMLILFMERYSVREDALLVWAAAFVAGKVASPPPRVLDITAGHKAVLAIVAIAKTMHEIEQSIPKGEFMAILTSMAGVVNNHVSDKSVRKMIQREWLAICSKYVV